MGIFPIYLLGVFEGIKTSMKIDDKLFKKTGSYLSRSNSPKQALGPLCGFDRV
jgi:hypothetical protein